MEPQTALADRTALADQTALLGRTALVCPTVLLSDDERDIAALEAEYQSAVQKNDVAALDRLLADDFVLVTGKGRIYTKTDLMREAAAKGMVYERREVSNQTVRIWDNTAVMTALLWAKGKDHGRPFEYRLWFSDTYIRTSSGWRCVFGQSSLHLPKE